MKHVLTLMAAALLVGCGSNSETVSDSAPSVSFVNPTPTPTPTAPPALQVRPGLREAGGQRPPSGGLTQRPSGTAFVALGALRSGDTSEAFALSPEGTVVTGASINADGSSRLPFRWSQTAGLQALPVTSSKPGGEGHAASRDGTVLGGLGILFDLEAAQLWNASGVLTIPGVVPPNLPPQIVTGLSSDGAVAVGMAGTGFLGSQGFRWVQGQANPTGLGFLGGTQLRLSNANGCSSDASVITGQSTTSDSTIGGYRWTASGMVPLPALPNLPGNAGWDVSSDGRVIVGWSLASNGPKAPSFPAQATAWRPEGPVSLGQLPDSPSSHAYGVSGDGSTIVGAASSSGGLASQVAFIWDATRGMQRLQSLLGGAVPANWHLLVATDISDDGQFVTGYGLNPDNLVEAFWADLP